MTAAADPLTQFNAWAENYLKRIGAAERKKLAATIGKKLRQSQAARIKAP
jgi:hypothetical protein